MRSQEEVTKMFFEIIEKAIEITSDNSKLSDISPESLRHHVRYISLKAIQYPRLQKTILRNHHCDLSLLMAGFAHYVMGDFEYSLNENSFDNNSTISFTKQELQENFTVLSLLDEMLKFFLDAGFCKESIKAFVTVVEGLNTNQRNEINKTLSTYQENKNA